MKIKSVHPLLRLYYEIDNKIMLVYRPDSKSHWGTRCIYMDENYDPTVPYNHRSMLRQEVVIEFDDESYFVNKKLAEEVVAKLKTYNIAYSAWSSGNKSVHVHCLLNVGSAKNLPMLKETFMRFMGEGLAKMPDLQLCSTNHLIRCEYGLHEKTQKQKLPLGQSKNYPVVSEVPEKVWSIYLRKQQHILNAQAIKQVDDITGLPGFKYVLESEQFRASDDGRERALFMLIHCMKPKYECDKEGLVQFLQSWYRYSSGIKLSDNDIRKKVNYHWNKQYKIGKHYLYQLLESIGKKDLVPQNLYMSNGVEKA